MAWAIITIYTSKCAQMDPNRYLKRQNSIPEAKSVTSKKPKVKGKTQALLSLCQQGLRHHPYYVHYWGRVSNFDNFAYGCYLAGSKNFYL